MQVAKFTYNMFQENTYILHDETKECVIVDPGCHGPEEQKHMSDFIESNGLKPVRLILTHCHIDHVAGCAFVANKYDLEVECNQLDIAQLDRVTDYGPMFGFYIDEVPRPNPAKSLEEGMKMEFGNTTMDIIFTPGHAPGHICFYHESSSTLIAGDTLFFQSIGRTDLPGGDHQTLVDSIKTKLFALPDDTVVYCGHGPETKIGTEKASNPFLV